MRFFLLLTALLLAGCGFHLRGQVAMPFDTLYLKATNPGTLFILDLRRSLEVNNITLVDGAEEADVVLDVVFEIADKQVLSLGADGRVNEFRLNYRVSLRAYDLKQQDWLPAEEFTQRRDFSYDDTQILAKEAEEALLQKSMRAEMVQQIIRRLGNAKPQ
ncbi:MAG: LPS assembly lipoprotein LptE [Gallionella sp.]